MEIIKTSEYPIRYLCDDNHGKIIENEIQVNRGGYELIHYYNTHGRGNVSAELCSYQGEGYLVSVHAEIDREDIRDRKQVGFSQIFNNYEHAKKITLEKIEFYEKWVVDHIIWRMTREQYCEEVYPKAVKAYEKKLNIWNRQTKEYQFMNAVLSPEYNKSFIISSFEDIYMQGHKQAVMQAIKEGKDVPEEVRKEYEKENK